MTLRKMMSSWWKRFELYSYWDDSDYDGRQIPLINLSIDAGVFEVRPYAYHATNDIDRWRIFNVRLVISRKTFVLYVPFKPLPDYVPTGKAMLRTRQLQKEHEARRAAQKIQM